MKNFKYEIERPAKCIERQTIYVEAESKEEADEIVKNSDLFNLEGEYDILYETINYVDEPSINFISEENE